MNRLGRGLSKAIVAIALVSGGCRGTPPRVDEPHQPAATDVAEAPAEPVAVPASAPPPPTPGVSSSIEVQLRDFAGAPVSGARIVATPARPEQYHDWPGLTAPTARDEWHSLPPSWDLVPRAQGRTDADGRCVLTGLGAGLWSVAVDDPGRVRRAAEVLLGAGDRDSAVTLRAEPGRAFGGRVLTDDGRPIADAVVVATYPEVAHDGRCSRRDSPGFALVKSDADGVYRFDALPATVVGLSCGPPGSWSSHRWPVLLPSVAALDLVVSEGGLVEGTVRAEPDGVPVAGAEVTFSLATWHAARVFAHVTTDARGRYRLARFPGFAVHDVSVVAPGYWSHPRIANGTRPPFRIRTDTPNVLDLSLRPDTPEFAAVRGVVRGPAGPVAGADVVLVERGGGTWFSATRTTDADGRFHFMSAPPLRLAVIVEEAPGHYQAGMKNLNARDGSQLDPSGPFWITADAARPVDVDIPVRRGGRVTGRVLHEDGSPAGDALVYALGTRATSNADGTFVLDGLSEPETTTVSARTQDDELAGESAEMELGDGKDAGQVEIRLKPREDSNRPRWIAVTGKVRASDATTLGGAVVSYDGSWVPLGASGAFRLEAEVYGSWKDLRLEIEAPGRGETSVEVALADGATSADAGTIEVPRAGALAGRMTGSGGPLAGVAIALEHRRTSTGCSFDEDAQPVIVAVTGTDGSYAAAGVSGGKYDAHATAAGHVEEETDLELKAASGEDSSPDEWSASLSRETWLRGRLVRKDGRGVPGAQLHAIREDGERSRWSPGSVYGETEADGSFEIRVREGISYVVSAEPREDYEPEWAKRDGRDIVPESESVFREFTSPPLKGGGPSVELVVEDGATITGVVLGPDGAPLAGLKVKCAAGASSEGEEEEEDRFESEETTTDARGAFTLRALPDGKFDVIVEARLDGRLVERDVETGRSDLVLRMAARTVIEGVLLGEDGTPARGRLLIATRMTSREDENGGDSTTAKTDDAGKFRLVGCGDRPCRIELVNVERSWDSMSATWPLAGGAGVAPGAKDVSLRIPTRAQTRITGRVVDAAGKQFGGCTVVVHTPSGSIHYSPGGSVLDIDVSGLRLDAPCSVEATCGGPTWFLEVPAGTSDLVITAGPDGIRSVAFGGREITSPTPQKKRD